ncbi:hypothetical protein ACFQ1L_11465 [Phytohabitans flavus]|uniref:hypothetical protein n=1 Tax=Phytohabitans flavus TaxID=1076124 RepID=UPI0036410D6D
MPVRVRRQRAAQDRPAGSDAFQNLARSLDAGGYDTAPVLAAPNRSFADALGGTLPPTASGG